MYHVVHTLPAPSPLDFNKPRPADSVADALGSDAGPQDESFILTLNTAALLIEVRRSDQAIRETLTESPSPGR